jgi:hypothetical protein
MISIFFLVIFLGEAAYKLSPMVVAAMLGLAAIVLYLKYLCWALIWIALGLSRALGWLLVGLSKVGTWPMGAFKYVTEKFTGLLR